MLYAKNVQLEVEPGVFAYFDRYEARSNMGYRFSLEHFKDKKWFPVSEQRLVQAQQIYHRYGYYSLLLSWTPVIGDPITLIAGLMKENFWRFLLMVIIAKGGRYLTLYALYLGIF